MDDTTIKDEDLIREEITNCASITQVVFNEETDVLLVQNTYGEQYEGHQTVVWKDDDSGEIILGGKAQDLEAKYQAQTEGEIITDEVAGLFQECVKYIPEFENSYLDDRDGIRIEIADQGTLEVQETFYTSNELVSFLSAKLSDSMREILELLTSLFDARN